TLACDSEAGRVKCFRYQPTPAGRKPPAPPVGFFSSKGPSMLQSCGTSNFRHDESSKPTPSAPLASDFRKRQSLSNDSVMRAACAARRCAAARGEGATGTHTTKVKSIKRAINLFKLLIRMMIFRTWVK